MSNKKTGLITQPGLKTHIRSYLLFALLVLFVIFLVMVMFHVVGNNHFCSSFAYVTGSILHFGNDCIVPAIFVFLTPPSLQLYRSAQPFYWIRFNLPVFINYLDAHRLNRGGIGSMDLYCNVPHLAIRRPKIFRINTYAQ